VEIQRLRTFIRDEKNDSDTVVENLLKSNPLNKLELQHWDTAHFALNKIHIKQLGQIKKLPGFTGTKCRMGIWEGQLNNTTSLLVNDVENVTSNSIEGTAEDKTNETADDGELENGLSLVTDFMLLIVDWTTNLNALFTSCCASMSLDWGIEVKNGLAVVWLWVN
jgi:hypothetical protein